MPPPQNEGSTFDELVQAYAQRPELFFGEASEARRKSMQDGLGLSQLQTAISVPPDKEVVILGLWASGQILNEEDFLKLCMAALRPTLKGRSLGLEGKRPS
jgi:hypothetical protein